MNRIPDKVLQDAKVREAGARWPILKRMEVDYGRLIHEHWESYPSGFHVSARFTSSPQGEVGEKNMTFFLASGLDPIRNMYEKAPVDPSFTPSDTVGEVTQD